jgi:RHS repeat-associated protein
MMFPSASDLLTLTDGLNHMTTWQYNQYGWLTNKVDGLGRNAFQFAYNASGWVTNRSTPAKGNTGYTYDNVGNVTAIIYPQSTINYSYNADNQLTNMVDAVGTTTYSYTPAGQMASETGPWANDAVNYTYSQELRTALNLSQPSGSWSQSYRYDSAGRMTNNVSPAGAFGYSYNFQPASSLVTKISLPNGASVTNGYDSLARLTQTSLNNYWGHILDGYSYGYDSLSLRTNVTRNLGLTTNSVTAGYDNIGQLTSWIAKESSGTPRLNEQIGFGFDAAGNLYSRTNEALVQTFMVDAANELTNVTRSGTFTLSGATPAPATNVTVNGQAAQTYGDFTFASTNNTLTNGINTFAINATNVYGVATNNNLTLNLPTSVSLSFDSNGNVTNDGTRTFGYDSENQLTNVAVAGQWQSAFVYDGKMLRRIERDYSWNSSSWLETNEIHFIYDGNVVIQERNSNNVVQVTYTRGNDLSGMLQEAAGIGGLLARTDTNGSTFYHSDGNGNITALMDGNENIVARYLYGPFGKLLGQWGSMANINTYRFSSKEWNNNASLYYYGRRYYDPNLQRWLNQDPIQERGGFDLYRFVANNPINAIDPLGLLVIITTTQGNVINVWTAQQFINQVQAQPDGTISDINFVGHGNSVVQGISDDNTPVEGLSLFWGDPELDGPSINNNPVPLADVLNGKMAPYGRINLGGCQTAAKNGSSPNLAQAVSDAIPGVYVTGSTMTTYMDNPPDEYGNTPTPFTVNTYYTSPNISVNVSPSFNIQQNTPTIFMPR